MKIIPTKTPNSIKLLFSKYTWDFYERKEKKIYLTFDDGPTPEITEFVLEQLRSFNAKATFFCVGENIQKYPEIFKQIIADDHTIGNHTMNHLKTNKTSLSNYIKNVSECDKKIKQHIAIKSKLFRPPYGNLSRSKLTQLRKLGYQIILWDVLSKDWDINTSPKQCTENVVKNTKNGSIIVFHDSIKASRNLKTTLPNILEHFTEKGYTFNKI